MNNLKKEHTVTTKDIINRVDTIEQDDLEETRKTFKEQICPEIKNETSLITDKAFVVVGNVDAGKSSLISTLVYNILDDGRGSGRALVARHKHEIVSGKTSDISTRNLKFPNGKTAFLIDLAGHQKYFTTTAFGVSGMWPDYGIVVISPTRGILEMTEQHFKMLISYNIPVFIVVTRIDMALMESCKEVDRQIKKLCSTYKRTVEFMNGYDKYHSYVRGSDLSSKMNACIKNNKLDDKLSKESGFSDADIHDLEEYLNFEINKTTHIKEISQGLKMAGGKQMYIPVVYASNVNGYYLDVIRQAMMVVEPRDLWTNDDNANSIVKFFRNTLNLPNLGLNNNLVGSIFYIDSIYHVKGVGLVVTGINRGETINTNDELYIGPISKTFVKVKVRSMHNTDRHVIDRLDHHHRGCIAIKAINMKEDIRRNQLCRGMVMISKLEMTKNVCYRFDAAITLFGGHSATIRTGYSPLLHAGTIRQSAKLIMPDDNGNLNSVASSICKQEQKEPTQKKIKYGDVERVTFKFRMKPEYLDPGIIFVFRSGEIHGVGYIINILPLDKDDDAQPEPLKRRFRRPRPIKQFGSIESVKDRLGERDREKLKLQ
jgi:GTPase